jgi:GT2 family glycosyltransferase
MKIRYCVVTLNQFSWVIDKHLPSLDPSIIDGIHVFVSEVEEQTYNGEKFEDPCSIPQVMEQLNRFQHWKVGSSTKNYGVSNAWNLFIEEARDDGYDAVIIANDDIYLYEGVLQRFVESMQNNEFVCFEGQNAFSFYGIHIKFFNRVGRFDENFWPAYYEDNDYHYRMRLTGYDAHYVAGPSYFHAGSATLGSFDFLRKMMHHHNFSKNTDYYVAKWGGMPHEEQFTRPFNGEENLNNLKGKLARSLINGIEPLADED